MLQENTNEQPAVARGARRKSAEPKKHRTTTAEAYARDVRKFQEIYGGSIPCTAEKFVEFIRLQVKKVAPSTAYRRCMAIQSAHVQQGHPSPTADARVREALRWMAAGQLPQNLLETKTKARKPAASSKAQKAPNQAKPITIAMLHRIFDAMGTGRRSIDLRDRALLLLGRAGLKRGMILALNIEHCRFTEDALILVTGVTGDTDDLDKEARSRRTVALPRTRGPMCAVTAVEAWLEHLDRKNQTGPLFCKFDRGCDPVVEARLDAAWLSQILKRRMKEAGFEDVSNFSAESLRRGSAQEQAR